MSTIQSEASLVVAAYVYTEGATMPAADGEDAGETLTAPLALQLVTFDGDDVVLTGTREQISAVLDAARASLDMIPAT